MIVLLIYLIIFCLIIWLAWYIINNVLPEPFRKVANVILTVVVVIVMIMWLLNYVGAPGHLPRIR